MPTERWEYSMRWTVARKLILILSIIISIVLVISGVGFFSTTNLNENAKTINTKIIPKIRNVDLIDTEIGEIFSLLQRHLLSKDKAFKDTYTTEIEQSINELDKTFNAYHELLTDSNEIDLFESIKVNWLKWLDYPNRIVSDSNNGNEDLAIQTYFDSISDLEEIKEQLNGIISLHNDEADRIQHEGTELFNTVKVILIISTTIAIVISILSIGFLLRTIKTPILRLSEKFKQLAAGDLTIEKISINSKDEIGDLGTNFNLMYEQIKELVKSLNDHISTVAATSEQLSASAVENSNVSTRITEAIIDVSEGASLQLERSRESHDIFAEISRGMDQSSAAIQSVSDLAGTTMEYTIKGSEIMNRTVSKMTEIHTSTEETGKVVQSLNLKSAEIERIVALITGIANQTNLLALNAAIEAARAGEEGKGFAVVAGEIRNLAENSRDSATHIRKLIEEIQSEINDAIEAMDTSKQHVADGLSEAKVSGSTFDEISEMIKKVSLESNEIAHITKKINASTNNMKRLVDEVASLSEVADEKSQGVAAAAEEQHASMKEIAEASDGLSSMSMELKELISTFKI